MTHPYSGHPIRERSLAVSLDIPTTGLISRPEGWPMVVDGEVITSRHDDTKIPTAAVRRASVLRRAVQDPYWILMTLMIGCGLSITAMVVYGMIRLTLAVVGWLTTNGTTLVVITGLVVAGVLCCGARTVTCTGIHCGGCKNR
jgi:hypothetical protein